MTDKHISDSEFADQERNFLDLENMFSIHVDKRDNYVFNLNETAYINIDESNLLTHHLTHDMFWTTISYQLYNTTRLAWLLMKLNNVKAENIFDPKKAGDTIYYVNNDTVAQIIQSIQEG